ncbi:hypothetical protein IPL85_04540 [Candidatus Saccharibacteria bacterium]|nr:MAG: hypothetical protein IPL85_04540 [Candidatus Saccharibacteria bacterium]
MIRNRLFNKLTLGLASLALIPVGVAYALITAQATLSGNTISASPGLLISKAGSAYGTQLSGFTFNIIVGDTATPSEIFTIKNTTSKPLAIGLGLAEAISFSGGTVNNDKLNAILNCSDSSITANGTATALVNSSVISSTKLAAGATTNCTVSFGMDVDAITSGAEVTSNPFALKLTAQE